MFLRHVMRKFAGDETMDATGKPGFRGMKGLKKQRRIQVIGLAFLALVISTLLIGYAMRDGINFFRSPTQVLEEPPAPGEVFRIGGLVEEGSILRGQSETVSFRVTDTNATVPVTFTGILPDLFEEGQGMVGTGEMQNGVFVASEILAKHDETYMPQEVIDSLKAQGVYKDPQTN
jgi:cytochrome c-type biogenesis protein CcmE